MAIRMRYVSQMMNPFATFTRVSWVLMFVVAVASCGRHAASENTSEAENPPAGFHADNDIAMTVNSLVDAVRVGESLDSSSYNFDGILTDGQGMPLYTDSEGAPGEWSVRVEDTESAVISNVGIGDLMADDLRNYILSSLKMNAADHVTTYENPEKEGEIISMYDLGDAHIRFVTSAAQTPAGLEGWLMSIYVSRL